MARLPAAALAAALSLPALLGGCISFGPKTPPSLMTIAATTPVAAGATATATDKTAIAVLVPTVPATLATQRVAVVSGTTAVAYLKDGLWADAPNRLFRDVLAETIQARTGRLVPDPRTPGLSPDTRLSGRLEAFGLDATANAVVIRYDAVLAKSGVDQVTERRFEARVPVTAQAPQPVAAALAQASNQIAVEVSDWAGR